MKSPHTTTDKLVFDIEGAPLAEAMNATDFHTCFTMIQFSCNCLLNKVVEEEVSISVWSVDIEIDKVYISGKLHKSGL